MFIFFHSLVIAALSLGILGSASATIWTSKVQTVKWIYPNSNGNTVITLSEDEPACLNSGNPKQFVIPFGTTDAERSGGKVMTASALTAFALGSKVKLNFDQNSPTCTVNRLYIYN